jgi:hypothetical protein
VGGSPLQVREDGDGISEATLVKCTSNAKTKGESNRKFLGRITHLNLNEKRISKLLARTLAASVSAVHWHSPPVATVVVLATHVLLSKIVVLHWMLLSITCRGGGERQGTSRDVCVCVRERESGRGKDEEGCLGGRWMVGEDSGRGVTNLWQSSYSQQTYSS